MCGCVKISCNNWLVIMEVRSPMTCHLQAGEPETLWFNSVRGCRSWEPGAPLSRGGEDGCLSPADSAFPLLLPFYSIQALGNGLMPTCLGECHLLYSSLLIHMLIASRHTHTHNFISLRGTWKLVAVSTSWSVYLLMGTGTATVLGGATLRCMSDAWSSVCNEMGQCSVLRSWCLGSVWSLGGTHCPHLSGCLLECKEEPGRLSPTGLEEPSCGSWGVSNRNEASGEWSEGTPQSSLLTNRRGYLILTEC